MIVLGGLKRPKYYLKGTLSSLKDTLGTQAPQNLNSRLNVESSSLYCQSVQASFSTVWWEDSKYFLYLIY